MAGDSIRETLAKNIKRFRDIKNMSQADLAFDAGISIPFLSDIERGNKWPSPETISKIADALRIESYLLFLPDFYEKEENKILIQKLINEFSISQTEIIKTLSNKYL
ncbi:XRE family transcriptional regulator [Treponema ruminis]|uniref:Transcriptional regulator with XRE-family HTH domain n=1 Tax=Treponema ruminis TaxID=744515 RepID=A0A7W8GAL1_9SPIR|nr:helix-turn-helix transcriptional regulator [Treponema ruminis]MBB5226913.1 transcriptional regulator with XRE-family HTH domain [Treponema ruminis]QSI01340.1 XRE family transcriptional regulator [Treponema ruminis]